MTIKTTIYANIILSGKTFMVVDSANQCRFATSSEKKANNFLNRMLKDANVKN